MWEVNELRRYILSLREVKQTKPKLFCSGEFSRAVEL